MKEMTPLEEIRHSAAHVLATAVLRLYPDTQLDIGPPTESGFYYDFDSEIPFTPEVLEAIEAEMKKVIKENQKFEKIEVSREEATRMIKEMGQETYKLGRLDDIPEDEEISFYRNGEFSDLCAGTHVSYTKKIKAFKLLQVAGSYHRGDSANKQLKRIYGTAFATKDELKEHLERLEEAKREITATSGVNSDSFISTRWSAKASFFGNPMEQSSDRNWKVSFPRNSTSRDTPKSSPLTLENLISIGPPGTFPITKTPNTLPLSTATA